MLRLSMKKYAASVATTARPAYTQAARCRSMPPSDALTRPKIPAPPTMTGVSGNLSYTAFGSKALLVGNDPNNHTRHSTKNTAYNPRPIVTVRSRSRPTSTASPASGTSTSVTVAPSAHEPESGERGPLVLAVEAGNRAIAFEAHTVILASGGFGHSDFGDEFCFGRGNRGARKIACGRAGRRVRFVFHFAVRRHRAGLPVLLVIVPPKITEGCERENEDELPHA